MCCYDNCACCRVDVHGRAVDEVEGKPKRARVSFFLNMYIVTLTTSML